MHVTFLDIKNDGCQKMTEESGLWGLPNGQATSVPCLEKVDEKYFRIYNYHHIKIDYRFSIILFKIISKEYHEKMLDSNYI